jgi:hypothetical protein
VAEMLATWARRYLRLDGNAASAPSASS